MRSFKVAVLLLLLLPTLVLAQKKAKKPSLPAVFDHARYVYVEAVDGQEFDQNLYPADRMAIADVRDAIQAWGRYTLTVEREHADLVFVVRKGRLAEGHANGGISGMQGPPGVQFPGQQRSRGTGPGAGGDVGPEDDILKVCQLNENGKLNGPLWIHSFAGGLNPPRLLLFSQFKEDVEKAYPSAPASPLTKP